MKPFNLEEAKAGKKVVLKDGTRVRIICFDAKGDYPIVALVGEEEAINNYTNQGWLWDSGESEDDLFMASEKKEGWVVLAKKKEEGKVELFRLLSSTEQEAKESWYKEGNTNYWDILSIVKIEWEE